MPSERLDHDEAVGALLELTAAEWTDLLEGWMSTCETRVENHGRKITVACQLTGKSNGLGYIAFAKSTFDALIAAMASAVVAGEMELPRVKRVNVRESCQVVAANADGIERSCHRDVDHNGYHTDQYGHWHVDADGCAVQANKSIAKSTSAKCAQTCKEADGTPRSCFRVAVHEGDHEDSLGVWYESISNGVAVRS